MDNYISDFIYRGSRHDGPFHRSAVPTAAARFDVYLALHKAVRESIQSSLSALCSVASVASTELRSVFDRAELAIDLAESVAGLEQRHLHPLIDLLSPELTRHAAVDHAEGSVAASALRQLLRGLRNRPDGTELRTEMAVLESDFSAYSTDVACHMQREREAHNPLLWLHESDEALLGLQRRMIDDTPQHLRCTLAAWMARSVRSADRPALVAAVRHKVPAQAYDMLLDQLQMQSCPAPTAFALVA